MLSIRTLIGSVTAALALSLVAAPLTAYAGSKDPAAESKEAKQGKHAKRGKHGKRGDDAKQFPMKADAFKDLVEKRIAHGRERLDHVLQKHNVPDAVKAQVKKDYEDGAAAVRALAAKAQADGTVTKEEAKEVRALAKDLKHKAREKYNLGKDKKKDKGKTDRTA